MLDGGASAVRDVPVIAVIDTTSAIGTIGYDLNVPGLTAVMGTGTAADVTIMWSAGP